MSIRLTTGSRIAETSSKGNQEKWLADGRWYKLDLFGYEGLAEAVTSALLAQTNTDALGFRYVTYRMERLEVHGHTRNGCSSANFLRQGEAILTLAELLLSRCLPGVSVFSYPQAASLRYVPAYGLTEQAACVWLCAFVCRPAACFSADTPNYRASDWLSDRKCGGVLDNIDIR